MSSHARWRRSAALIAFAAVAGSVSALASASSALPSNKSAFSFDGTTSDVAQQLYWRMQAGDELPPIMLNQVPRVVASRLHALHLDFNRDLPGLLQRAVLWDSGYVTAEGRATALQVRTRSGTMTDLALTYDDYLGVGCVALECNGTALPTYYSSQFCNGRQILSAARCVIDAFESAGESNFAMWSDGGDPDMVPQAHVVDHSWVDSYTSLSYTVYAVHSLSSNTEPSYGTCSKTGYGSLVIPCYPSNNPSASADGEMIEVTPSPWVTTWLEEYQASSGKGSPPDWFDKMLLIPIVGSGLLVIVVLVLVCSRARRQHQTFVHRRSTREHQSEQNESYDDELTHYKHMQAEFGSGNQSDDTGKSGSRPTLSTSESSFSLWSAPGNIDNSFDTTRGYGSEDTDSYVTNSLLRTLNSDAHIVGRRVRYDQVHFFSMLSRGAYGEVWLCGLDGQQVAVKRLRRNKDIKFTDIQDFIHEIQVSASLEHPNIVRVLGVAWNTLYNLCMVIDYLPRGDLQSYLRKHGDLLTWGRDKVFLAIGIAQALEYLHTREPPLIHRDLKSKNVLLTRTLDPQLIDFGVSRRRKEETMTAGVGTPYWTAPEVLAGERYTEQTDIYSFGVLLSELDTCEAPFYDVQPPVEAKMRPIQIMNGVMSGELRPSFRDDCPARIRRLGLACLEQDPSNRPTAREALQTLDR